MNIKVIFYGTAFSVVLVLILLSAFAYVNVYVRHRSLYTCVQELASVLSQHDYVDTRNFKFLRHNLPFGFNCNAGLIVKSKKKYSYTIQYEKDQILICFRNNVLPGYITSSKTYICELDKYFNVKKAKPLYVVADDYEDGRLFCLQNDLFLSASKNLKDYVTKQDVIRLRDKAFFRSSLNNIKGKFHTEKNWQFFEWNSRCYVIYSVMPLTIYELDQDFEVRKLIVSHKWLRKDGIELRCSTPPVYVAGAFYMVVHSIDYRSYMLMFSADFNSLACTTYPICESARCKYYIYFPCGLLYDERVNNFIISIGINNRRIGIMKMSKHEIDKNMKTCVLIH